MRQEWTRTVDLDALTDSVAVDVPELRHLVQACKDQDRIHVQRYRPQPAM